MLNEMLKTLFNPDFRLPKNLFDGQVSGKSRILSGKKFSLVFVIMLIMLLALSANLLAADYYVDPSGTDDGSHGGGTGTDAWKTIEYAVNNVSDPTTATIVIHVSGDIYTINSDVISINRGFGSTSGGLTIQGAGAGSTIVQAESSSGTATNMVFYIDGSDESVTLKDMTIRNGKTTGDGAGIYNYNSTLTIKNCSISNNETNSYGGGIYNSGSTVILENCTINGNSAGNSGGGVFNGYSSTLTMTNCTVYGNEDLNYGGGVYNWNSSITITNCTISGNNSTSTSFGNGGGLFHRLSSGSSELYIKNTIIANNSAAHDGDDFYNLSGTVTNNGYNIVETQNGSDFTNGVNGCIVGAGTYNLSTTLEENNTTNGTYTLKTTSGSFAIDAGTSDQGGHPEPIPLQDQRGANRNGATDIGAYENPFSAPTVTTQAVTDITSATATGNGNITGLGNQNPTQHGVCWSTLENPTTVDDKTEEGAVSSTGAFTSNITGLNPETLYYVRAYATNTARTSYGEQLNFTTLITPAPTIQDSNITFSNVQENQMDISWTNGNGLNRAVFMLQGSSGTASPSDSTSYTANSIFMSGDQIGSSGWYCVYNGTGSSVTVTNLSPDTEYRVMVCGYNYSAGFELYNTNPAINNPNNQTSAMTPPGNALDFDGSDDYVSCGDDASVQIEGNISVEAWVRLSAGGVWQSVVTKLRHLSDRLGYELNISPDNKACFGGGNNWNDWSGFQESSVTISLNTWTHIAGTYDGSTIKIYVNGKFSGSTTYANGITDSEQELRIGKRSNDGQQFSGRIDEVRVWNVARTQAQIQATIYNTLGSEYYSSTDSGLVAYYRFDEGAPGGDNTGVTTLPDLTLNGNDGILNNFTLTGSTSNWVSSGAMDNEAPAKPGGLYAIALNDAVELHWSANTESDLSYYKVYRNTSSDTSSAYSIGISNPDTSFTDTNVENDTLYYYWVTAVDSASNESNFSSGDAAVPTVKSGNAVDLDGDGDYIDRGDIDEIDGIDKLTIEAWVQWRTLDRLSTIVAKRESHSDKIQFGLGESGNTDDIRIQIGNSGTLGYGYTTGDIISTGVWYHLAMVFDGTQVSDTNRLKLYMNGVEQSLIYSGTIPATTDEPNTAPVTIGNETTYPTQTNVDGMIDEVRIWSIERDSADIAADMKRPLRGDEEGLVALWHMDEPPGTGTAYDATPNANDGTLQDDADFVSSDALPNYAPVFISALPDTSFDEDTLLKFPLSFWFEYVEDVDDADETLVWSIEGNDNIFTEISSDTVIFSSLADWYGMDTLTVIVSDLGELSDTTTLAVTVNAVNDAPLPFGLISPTDDETIDSLIIPFVWQESIDPDPEDVVSYAFRLFGPGVDTTITELSDTSFIFDGSNILQSDTVYSWYVEATDGVEITTSAETFQFRTPSIVGVDIFDQIPDNFSLRQNYPNPFNPVTTIAFGLPEESDVVIDIYNIMGQKVRMLVSEKRQPGYYFIQWDSKNDFGQVMPTGMYIYCMRAGSFQQIKKMVLLK